MSAAKKPSNPADFTVIRAEKQMFYGGVAGSPVVTTYTLFAKARVKQVISVDSGWAEGKADQAVILLDSGKTCQKKTVKLKQQAAWVEAIINGKYPEVWKVNRQQVLKTHCVFATKAANVNT